MQTQSETVGERTVNHETELWSQKSVLTYQHLKVKSGSGTRRIIIIRKKYTCFKGTKCLFWCGLTGYDWWDLLTVSFCRKQRTGQWLPTWDDRLTCWSRNFLEVRARQDWNDSLHLLLTWNICRDTLLRQGDSIKNSADTCGRRLLLLSHQQSHFHWTVFQCRLIFLLYLVPQFPFQCFPPMIKKGVALKPNLKINLRQRYFYTLAGHSFAFLFVHCCMTVIFLFSFLLFWR